MSGINDYLPLWLTTDTLIVAMAGAAAFMSVVAVWYALLHRDPLAPRLKMLAERRAVLKAGFTMARRRSAQNAPTIGFMRRVVSRLNLMRSGQVEKISRNLLTAGFRSRDAVVVYLFLKLALPIGMGALAVILLYALGLYDLGPTGKLVASIGAIKLGFLAPSIFVKNAMDKRKHAIRRGVPDALDLLVICAEAGLSMDAAFDRVSREMAEAFPEIAEEFALTGIELSFLPERRKALENLSIRTNLQELRAVVNTLIQTEKYGTPLASSLRVLAAEFRDDRLMRAEEKAARLPAILTIPMILFILPSLFVVLIGPAALKTIDALSKLV